MSKTCDMPIDAYHDGELSPRQRSVVEKHLEQCPVCARRLKELQALSAALAAQPRPKLSQIAAARLTANLEARLRQDRIDRDRMRIAWRFGAAAACIVLAGTLWLSRTSAPAQAAPPWVELTAANVDSTADQLNSPVAQWYLASAWKPDSSAATP